VKSLPSLLLNGGADKGGRHVLGTELCYYTRVSVCDCKRVENEATPLEQTFVLADLFTVESHSLEIPNHILESDEGLEDVCCPECHGEKFLEVAGNDWTRVLFSDVRRAYAHRALNLSYKPCERCGASGEVLELATPSNASNDVLAIAAPQTHISTWLQAA
jgi:hypothetical protein